MSYKIHMNGRDIQQQNYKNDVTIVIITHYRHKYLKRAFDYYSDCGIKILVADSTNVAYKKKLPENVIYYHSPDYNPIIKISEIMKFVSTKYTVICADDDFTSVSAILRCVKFLNQNKDYTSAQGNYIFFKYEKNKLNEFPLGIENYKCDIKDDNIELRLKRSFNPYVHLSFPVIKTTVLKRLYSDYRKNEMIKSACLYDILPSMYTVISGKHFSLPVFFSAREDVRNSEGDIQIPYKIDKIALTANGRKDIQLLISMASKYLMDVSGMKYKDCERIIHGFIYNDCIPFFRKAYHVPIYKKVFSILKAFLPEFIMKIKRKIFKQISNEERYKNKIEKTKELEGFPFFQKDAEWERMKELIFKHDIKSW